MQVNSIPSLTQLNELQAMIGNSSNTSTDNTSSAFSTLLQGMLQNVQSTPNTIDSTAAAQSKSSIDGVNNLSVDPQKLAQMLQLQAMQNMFTSTSSTDSDSISSDDSNSDDGTQAIDSSTNDMSQLYNYILEETSQNSGLTGSSQAASDPNTLIQSAAGASNNTSAQY